MTESLAERSSESLSRHPNDDDNENIHAKHSSNNNNHELATVRLRHENVPSALDVPCYHPNWEVVAPELEGPLHSFFPVEDNHLLRHRKSSTSTFVVPVSPPTLHGASPPTTFSTPIPPSAPHHTPPSLVPASRCDYEFREHPSKTRQDDSDEKWRLRNEKTIGDILNDIVNEERAPAVSFNSDADDERSAAVLNAGACNVALSIISCVTPTTRESTVLRANNNYDNDDPRPSRRSDVDFDVNEFEDKRDRAGWRLDHELHHRPSPTHERQRRRQREEGHRHRERRWDDKHDHCERRRSGEEAGEEECGGDNFSRYDTDKNRGQSTPHRERTPHDERTRKYTGHRHRGGRGAEEEGGGVEEARGKRRGKGKGEIGEAEKRKIKAGGAKGADVVLSRNQRCKGACVRWWKQHGFWILGLFIGVLSLHFIVWGICQAVRKANTGDRQKRANNTNATL